MNKIVKNSLFNTIGMFIYMFCQWLMSILVVRLSGSYEEAGIFSTALSVTNVLYIVSSFSIRNYQVADINNNFSDSEYISFRILTCIASLSVLPIYLLIMHYSLYTSLSVVCYMIIKIGEAIVDVIHGIFQKEWRLDLACRSYIVRGIAILAVFSVTEYLFKNLVISLLLSAIISLICAIIFDIVPCKKKYKPKISLKNHRLFQLFICGLPVFIHGFLSTLIYNVPRIAAQKICGEELFGYYASVAAPTVVIQLVVGNIFSPCITLMSEQYINKDKKLFISIGMIQSIIIVIAILAVISFSVFGNWFLGLVFGVDVLEYSNLLILAVIAAILIANTAFISSVFTASNHNIIMAALECVTFIIDLTLSVVLIQKYGLQGINYTLIASCLIFIVIGYCILIMSISADYKRNN